MNKVLLAVLTLAFASAASAGADQYRFAYAKADFTDVASVQDLHKRIIRTARDFCPGYLPSKNLADTRRCVEEVTQEIVQSIDNPALTAMATGDVGDVRIALDQERRQRAKRG